MKKKYVYSSYSVSISNSAYIKLMGLGVKANIIIPKYDELHRFYHDWNHIESLLIEAIKGMGLEHIHDMDDALFLAIIFHDVVYNPKLNNNEELSAKMFCDSYDGELKEEVSQAILDTKNHIPSNKTSEKLCELDLKILQSDLSSLIDYENKIFKEFQFVDWKKYKKERIEVLRKLQKNNELENLIYCIESRKPNIGIYSGSFNPFTKGHYNILEQAERVFDKVIIARGKNLDKKEDLRPLPEAIQFRQIENYEGLLTDFINKLDYDVTLIRGLRSVTDLQHELNQLRFLQNFKKDIKVVSFFCDKQFEHISSSAVRQLEKIGEDKKYIL